MSTPGRIFWSCVLAGALAFICGFDPVYMAGVGVGLLILMVALGSCKAASKQDADDEQAEQRADWDGFAQRLERRDRSGRP